MKLLRHLILAPLVLGAPLALASPASAFQSRSTILETAQDVGGFEILLSLVRTAGLGRDLQGDGPFTVFAPLNQAFLDLGPETIDALTQPENAGLLASILTYHVLPGEFDAATLIGLDFVTTLNGQRLDLEFDGQTLFVDGNPVQLADVGTSNGIIHVIDTVLMPVQDSIAEVAEQAGIFGTLLTAISAAELEALLQRPGPFTVFAPTDDAFADLDPTLVQSLLEPANQAQLIELLAYHVVPNAAIYADQAVLAGSAVTLQGQAVTITTQNGSVFIDDAQVVLADVEASNGVVHVIDAVLMP